jgi:hypothetical protein
VVDGAPYLTRGPVRPVVRFALRGEVRSAGERLPGAPTGAGSLTAGLGGVVLWECELRGERTAVVTTGEPSGRQDPAAGPEPRSYEPGPSGGKLLLFVAVFVAFAVIVVGGGVILTAGG